MVLTRGVKVGNLAENSPLRKWPPSGGCGRLPKLNRVAFGIVNPGEAADFGMSVPFGLCDDLYSRGIQLFQQAVEIADAKVDHHLLVGREIVAVLLERLERDRPRLRVPEPFVGLALLAGAHAAADAKMLPIPGLQAFRIPGPEEVSAHSQYRHVLLLRARRWQQPPILTSG